MSYPPHHQGGHQGYADPFSDRHSPAGPRPQPGATFASPTPPPPPPPGSSPYGQGPPLSQGHLQRPYALHDNPSYASTLPTGSSYSLAGGHGGGGGEKWVGDEQYPDEETESKTPLRTDFGQVPYDQDQPLSVPFPFPPLRTRADAPEGRAFRSEYATAALRLALCPRHALTASTPAATRPEVSRPSLRAATQASPSQAAPTRSTATRASPASRRLPRCVALSSGIVLVSDAH